MARVQMGPKRPLAALYTAFSNTGKGPRRSASGDVKAGGYAQAALNEDGAAPYTTSRYVQDLLLERRREVKTAMANDGVFLVCGASGMGNAVIEALPEVLEMEREKVFKLRDEGRILVELWG